MFGVLEHRSRPLNFPVQFLAIPTPTIRLNITSLTESRLAEVNRYLLDAVVPVAEPIPLGLFRLRPARHVGCARAKRRLA